MANPGSLELVFNSKTTGAVQIPAKFDVFFFIQSLSFVATQVAGKNSSATVSVGTNSPNYDNILGATSLSGLAARGDFINFNIESPTVERAFSTVSTPIFVNVTVGASATTFNVAVQLRGQYFAV